jgi:hypothetical protein
MNIEFGTPSSKILQPTLQSMQQINHHLYALIHDEYINMEPTKLIYEDNSEGQSNLIH